MRETTLLGRDSGPIIKWMGCGELTSNCMWKSLEIHVTIENLFIGIFGEYVLKKARISYYTGSDLIYLLSIY
jgi:hypothetical protein